MQPDGVHVATSVDTPSFVIVQVMVSMSTKSVQVMLFVTSSSTSTLSSRHLWIFTAPASQHVFRSVWNFCSQRYEFTRIPLTSTPKHRQPVYVIVPTSVDARASVRVCVCVCVCVIAFSTAYLTICISVCHTKNCIVCEYKLSW